MASPRDRCHPFRAKSALSSSRPTLSPLGSSTNSLSRRSLAPLQPPPSWPCPLPFAPPLHSTHRDHSPFMSLSRLQPLHGFYCPPNQIQSSPWHSPYLGSLATPPSASSGSLFSGSCSFQDSTPQALSSLRALQDWRPWKALSSPPCVANASVHFPII